MNKVPNLSPAISIDQKTTSKNPRSTVGTVTEIYDYFRLLFARIGVPYCPVHNIPIEASTITQIIDKVLDNVKKGFQSKLTDEKVREHLNRDVFLGMFFPIRIAPLFIKKVFMELGYLVDKLSRIELAFLNLDGLKSGEYRELTIKEVKKLYEYKK